MYLSVISTTACIPFLLHTNVRIALAVLLLALLVLMVKINKQSAQHNNILSLLYNNPYV